MKTAEIAIGSVVVGEGRRALRKVDELASSIHALGLLNPITVTKDLRLVAGYHRLEACRMLGWSAIPAHVVTLDALHAELAEIDENLIRNELTALEQSEQLARRKEIYLVLFPATKQGGAPGKAGGGKAKAKNETISSFARETAAKAGVSERSVQHGVQIAAKLDGEVREAIRGTPTADSKTDLLTLARLPKAEQREVVQQLKRGAKDVRAAVSVMRREQRTERVVEISKGNTELTGELGRFPVIYADPPWQYDAGTAPPNREIENQYPTMPLEEICALPVAEIATPDAVLFLWATSPKLSEAMEVIISWGFTYRTNMVWDKGQVGMGYYVRQQHELLLIATRGEKLTPAPRDRPASVLCASRGKQHSAKPVEFRELIERMYPAFKRVELFCRSAPAGWATWGNQS